MKTLSHRRVLAVAMESLFIFWPIESTSLACMFCFPNTGHVMILKGTLLFKCHLIDVHIYA